MSSVLESSAAAPGLRTEELLVVWQDPESRRFVPIGRLARAGDQYEFSYTKAAGAADLRPLPGLRLDQRYRGPLPPVFMQRVMGDGRPDFEQYVRRLGLSRAEATPWEQIVRSAGHRAGDTLQFIPLPRVDNGRALARFLVNGVRHIPDYRGGRRRVTAEQHRRALDSLTRGSALVVQADDNPHDPDACLVTHDEIPIGWVPRILSRDLRELGRHGTVHVGVIRVGDPDGPAHLRLAVELNTAAPPGFRFDPDGQWEPLVPSA